MSNLIFQEIADKIIELIAKNGTVPWRQPWTSNGPPRNLVSRRPYRGINVFLLGMKGHASPFWITPAQLERLGGEVRADEEPTGVICWMWRHREVTTGRKAGGREKTKILWNLWGWSHLLFNTDQCTGIEKHIPKIRKRRFSPLETCEKIVSGMPQPPEIHIAVSQAFYQPLLDLVNMPNSSLFTSNEAYYSTLFHELTHSTGHQSRLGRHGWLKGGFHPDAHEYSKEELVAELAAAMLCGYSGIENATIDSSAAYIEHWMNRLTDDCRTFILAAHDAQKAADFILGKRQPRVKEVQPPDSG